MRPRTPPPSAIEALPPFPALEDDDRSGHSHRRLIGTLGMALPPLLWVIAGWRATPGLARWQPLTSVSAYYHTGAVVAFVGILIALAVYLFTYRGYDNRDVVRDRFAASVAGAAAVLVAFFPTCVPDGVAVPPWWTPAMGRVHYVAAVVLFGSFIYFSLVLFPKSKAEGEAIAPDKRTRKWIYRLGGVAMVGCIVWAGVASLRRAPIVWPETLALEFFAVSWLTKGRALQAAAATAWRTLYYGRHPGHLVRAVRRAMRPAPRDE